MLPLTRVTTATAVTTTDFRCPNLAHVAWLMSDLQADLDLICNLRSYLWLVTVDASSVSGTR